ncbi:hypothetical protein PSY31_23175, partial [Shigella flexneri]|nr:hypothetical protein [Shigella flexneri]
VCRITSHPLLIGGDFNVVASPEEKLGRRGINLPNTEAFLDTLRECRLTDAGFSGSKYTWSNNRTGTAKVLKRLDRLLLSEAWIATAQ